MECRTSDAGSEWAGWALAHPEFGSSVNPITTRGADYDQGITASPPGFEIPAASLHLFLINLEVWNFITLKLSYLCSTLNFRRRDPFQNWPLHPLAVNMVGWFLIQLKMNLSVIQLFYLLALFWQKSSHALPALYPGSGLLKLVIDTELLPKRISKMGLLKFY